MENRFNLVDEPWIPVADHGRVSLRDIFSNRQHRSLGGNPVQKIALLKLLLAIAQAAATPDTEAEWQALGAEGLASRCLAYLDKWHDRFYLYGEQPFLQMLGVKSLITARTKKRLGSAAKGAKTDEALASGRSKGFGAGFYPDLPSSNNTVLSHGLLERNLSDAERAVFLVSIMNFAFGGKRVEADISSMSGSVLGNRYSAPAGPSLGGWSGYLHSFVFAQNILSTLWLNLLSVRNIESLSRWPSGLGVPVWESMPGSENDSRATSHKLSYQAALIALSRFVLLDEQGIYYLDGINYPSVKDGWFEPSLLINSADKDIKVKYVDPAKRPWREIEGMLSFLGANKFDGFECFSIRLGIDRARAVNEEIIAVWSGGLRVSANSGDQSVKQSDDFVDSMVWLHSAVMGDLGFMQLKLEMNALDTLSRILYGSVVGFFEEQKVDKKKLGKNIADQATQLFWQLCERDFQSLVDACDGSEQAALQRQQLRRRFAGYVQQAFDQFCPRETARQLDAWAKCRPNNSTYLKQEA